MISYITSRRKNDVLISINTMIGAYDLDDYVSEWIERKEKETKRCIGERK